VGLGTSITLFDKDEAEALAERPITKKEWESVYNELAGDESIWQVIDDAIKDAMHHAGLMP
jgi:hypothetical protein